jgi:hypothetical protein
VAARFLGVSSEVGLVSDASNILSNVRYEK